MKLTLGLIIFFTSSLSYAFNLSNVGHYMSLDQDGQVTGKVYRILHEKNGWRVEEKKENGNWQDVNCEKGCMLAESKDKEVEYLMGGKTPPGMSAECIHNPAFGICDVSKQDLPAHSFILVIPGEKTPISLRLIRMKKEISPPQ